MRKLVAIPVTLSFLLRFNDIRYTIKADWTFLTESNEVSCKIISKMITSEFTWKVKINISSLHFWESCFSSWRFIKNYLIHHKFCLQLLTIRFFEKLFFKHKDSNVNFKGINHDKTNILKNPKSQSILFSKTSDMIPLKMIKFTIFVNQITNLCYLYIGNLKKKYSWLVVRQLYLHFVDYILL